MNSWEVKHEHRNVHLRIGETLGAQFKDWEHDKEVAARPTSNPTEQRCKETFLDIEVKEHQCRYEWYEIYMIIETNLNHLETYNKS